MINVFKGVNGYLSNFYVVRISYDGLVYPSVEHAYQASKTIVRGGRDPFAIGGMNWNAASAKWAGKNLTLRPDWEKVKLGIMLQLIRQKFTNYEDIRQKLINTDGHLLVESNYWHDDFWGNCTCIRCNKISGQNHLGKILMRVREELRP